MELNNVIVVSEVWSTSVYVQLCYICYKANHLKVSTNFWTNNIDSEKNWKNSLVRLGITCIPSIQDDIALLCVITV